MNRSRRPTYPKAAKSTIPTASGGLLGALKACSCARGNDACDLDPDALPTPDSDCPFHRYELLCRNRKLRRCVHCGFVRGYRSRYLDPTYEPPLDHDADRPSAPEGECAYCGSVETLTADHIYPQSAGGGRARNIAWVCRPCNQSKGSLLLEAWLGTLPPDALQHQRCAKFLAVHRDG